MQSVHGTPHLSLNRIVHVAVDATAALPFHLLANLCGTCFKRARWSVHVVVRVWVSARHLIANFAANEVLLFVA